MEVHKGAFYLPTQYTVYVMSLINLDCYPSLSTEALSEPLYVFWRLFNHSTNSSNITGPSKVRQTIIIRKSGSLHIRSFNLGRM